MDKVILSLVLMSVIIVVSLLIYNNYSNTIMLEDRIINLEKES